MAKDEVVETSEAQIAVHWQEEDYVYPSKEFIEQANIKDEAIYERFALDIVFKFSFCSCYFRKSPLL